MTVVHGTHVLWACAPSCAENDPALQGVHAVAPAEGAKKPATHAVHATLPGRGAYDPLVQGEHSALPAGDEHPGGHGTHTAADAPPGALYADPAGHGRHVDAESGGARKLPAGQIPAQRATEAAPTVVVVEPSGHGAHSALCTASA